MNARFLLSVAVLFLPLIAPASDPNEKKEHHAKVECPALEPFKQLAGDWNGRVLPSPREAKPGPEIRVQYKVTSNGSAVVETLFPDTPEEMVTVIHPDGEDLLLTHYCALGNQPCMRAHGKENDKKITFKFDHATNMKSDKDAHMHEVTYTFVDKNTLKSEWVHYVDGKAGGTAVFEFKRKQ